LAYDNGAKYIIVFDGDQNWTQNVLLHISPGQPGYPGQLDAMKEFWQYVKANPQTISPVSDRTAYVLPADYAYGFRGPNDRIWGLWDPDSLTDSICRNVSTLMQEYSYNLDIVYPNGTYPVESLGYKNIFYWNDPRLIDTPITSAPATATGSQKNLTMLEIYVFSCTAVVLTVVAVVAMLLKFKKH
jgi:hypothetical protein